MKPTDQIQPLNGKTTWIDAGRMPFRRFVVAAVISLLMWPGSGLLAEVETSITVNNDRVDTVVKEGEMASTACFSFRTPIDSAMEGVGCRMRLLEQRNMPFILVEVLSAQDGLDLKAAGAGLLQGIANNIASSRHSQRGIDNPGPYDSSNEGRFLGGEDATVSGQPAIKYSWAMGNRGSGYKSIKVRTLVVLPEQRFVWDGQAQGFLLVTGNELGFKSALFNSAIESLKIH